MQTPFFFKKKPKKKPQKACINKNIFQLYLDCFYFTSIKLHKNEMQ